MDPPFITIGMFNMNPGALAIEDFKRHAFFNGKKYREVCPGTRADIAGVIVGNYRGNLANQRFMHPSFVSFKVLKMIPLTGLFNYQDGKIFFYFP